MNRKIFFVLPILVALAGFGAFTVARDATDKTNINNSQFLSDSYVDIDTYSSNLAKYSDKRVVYFFHAGWCPTCRALEKDIQKNIGNVPSDVVIVKTDFDSQKELKEKYGVMVQHTLVQVKSDGTIVGKWVAQPSLSSVLQDLQTI